MKDLDGIIAAIKDELVRMRKDFHRFPEVGFQEFRSADKAAEYMKNLDFEIQTGPMVPIHDPKYIFNDEILITGVKAFCEIVLKYNDWQAEMED